MIKKSLIAYNIKQGGDGMNFCDFGTVLRQLRKSHNLTQAKLGAHVGLSKTVVSKYENGMSYQYHISHPLFAKDRIQLKSPVRHIDRTGDFCGQLPPFELGG